MMNLRSYLKRQTLPKILKTRKEKEKSTLIIEALKFFFKTKTHQNKKRRPQLNEVFKNTEKSQIFCGNLSKKNRKKLN